MVGIYKITNPKGRVYIGQSIDILKRWRDYYQLNSKTKRQVLLWRSFLKYGVSDHLFEVIEECELHELNIKERFWQEHYDVLNGGLNCVYQKTDYIKRKVSKETRRKISEGLKGLKVLDENKEKTRLRMMGNTYSKGRKRSQSEKDLISKKMKKISGGNLNNMYGKFGEDNPNSKIILNNYTGIFYFGCKEAALYNSIPLSKVKKSLCGNRLNKTPLTYV